MFPGMDKFTSQGYDMQWGTNVLGPYLLTKLLLPTLETTAAMASPEDPVRIIEISSSMHLLNINSGPNLICYESLHGESPIRTYIGDLGLYSQSKSGNILVSKARARLLKNPNIISVSVHPGTVGASTCFGSLLTRTQDILNLSCIVTIQDLGNYMQVYYYYANLRLIPHR